MSKFFKAYSNPYLDKGRTAFRSLVRCDSIVSISYSYVDGYAVTELGTVNGSFFYVKGLPDEVAARLELEVIE